MNYLGLSGAVPQDPSLLTGSGESRSHRNTPPPPTTHLTPKEAIHAFGFLLMHLGFSSAVPPGVQH